MRAILFGSGLLLASCIVDSRGSASFDATGGAVDASTSASEDPSTTRGPASGSTASTQASLDSSASDAGSSSPDDAPVFDLGVPDAGPEVEGCQLVDLLFVVDASFSMQDEQDNLVASFPGFIEAITETLGTAHDYHVGIVTTEAYEFNEDGCDDALGQLVTQTGGSESSAQVCGPFAAGGRYMTTEDDLASAFACAADVGIQGDLWERPMEAMLTVVSGAFAEPGGCNEGFLRDDSLLVIVVITDEADGPGDPEANTIPTQTSAGTPQSWFDDLVAARGGVESNIVVLTLNMFFGGPCPPTVDGAGHLEGGVFDGTNIHDFTMMFTHGFAGGICEPSYAGYFTQAVDVVDTACADFRPQG